MALLAIAITLIAPRMSDFFRGRTLDSEARHLLALMHHGQSRAVSEGIPTVLWIDAEQGTFGLEQEPGYTTEDPEALTFTLEGSVHFEIPPTSAGGTPSPTTTSAAAANTRYAGLPQIHFRPDASISETSPITVRLVAEDGSTLWLTQSRDRQQYEIRSATNQWNSADW